MSWQPMDTAPRDGKLILGVYSKGEFFQQMGRRYNKQGYYTTVTTGFRESQYPTHWMPLPNPPETL